MGGGGETPKSIYSRKIPVYLSSVKKLNKRNSQEGPKSNSVVHRLLCQYIVTPRAPQEVNPYKKVATFASFFCVHSSIKVSTLSFFSDEHIVKQSKTSMLHNNIYKQSIYYIKNRSFLKIFNIVGNLKKGGHHEKSWRKVRVKAATFLTGLPLRSLTIRNCTLFPCLIYITKINKFQRRRFVFFNL